MSRPHLVLSAFALVTLLTRASVQAEEEFRPPFWPAWYHPEKTVVPETPGRLDHVEFRGILSVAGETFITLVDTTSSHALTIPLDHSVEGITVSDLRVEAGTVRARAAGRDRVLALHESRIVALAPPRPSPPPAHVGGLRRRSDPTSDVAREIARRRDMRRQLLEAGKSPNMSPAPNRAAAHP